MPVVAINVVADRAVAAQPLMPLLRALPVGAPVTIMLHGYRYAPGDRPEDPHRTLYANWARRLGFRASQPGLAIGLGWQGVGPLRAVHDRAGSAAVALARLLADLRAAGAPPVNLIGHSLGARVALGCLRRLEPGDVGRIALLSGAEFAERAERALATPAGRAAEVLNVTSRENDLFDLAFELMVPGCGAALGAGLSAPNAVTLQIDQPLHREGLRRLGFPVAPPQRLVCHWSAYTRPGLFPLYRAFLHRPAALPMADLRVALSARAAPRWSRLRLRTLPFPAVPVQ